MSTIVTRAGKGSALTHTELDANFTNLNNDKYQSGASPTFTDMYMGQYIYHSGDTDTYIQFLGDRLLIVAGGKSMLDNVEGGTDYTTIASNVVITDAGSVRLTDTPFYENRQTVTGSYTVTNGYNAMSAGPITINNGITVTIGDGEAWTIV